PGEHRLTDQKMTDVELNHLGKRRDRLSTRIVEAVAGMDLKSELAGKLGRLTDPPPFGGGRGPITVEQRVAPGAGVDLDHWRAECRRGLDLRRVRSNEQRHADAGLAKGSDPGA